jgi:hypothetical protein
MPDRDSQHKREDESQTHGTRLPQGFTVNSSGRASEYARELGWGINEEERTKTPREKQGYDGGRDCDYGAQDFGDTAENSTSAQRFAERNKSRMIRPRKSA